MKSTSRIIGGVALLAVGVVGALELFDVVDINFNGWWAFFVIIPCLASLFTNKCKTGSLIGLGVGILLLLSAQGVIAWHDFGKYVLCLMAVVFGLSLLFFRQMGFGCNNCHKSVVEDLKHVDTEGREIHKFNVSFSKQMYEFDGQCFEGAEVQTSFGFTSLDLRKADVLDGAVVNVDCSFGGMEIRVSRDICVRCAVETAFAGVESQCTLQPGEGTKTLYVKGKCSFGGIEIK